MISSYKLASMADPSKDELPQEQEAAQLLSQSRQILEEIKSFREQGEAYAKQAEVSRKNADSELFSHSTRSRLVKGTQPRSRVLCHPASRQL